MIREGSIVRLGGDTSQSGGDLYVVLRHLGGAEEAGARLIVAPLEAARPDDDRPVVTVNGGGSNDRVALDRLTSVDLSGEMASVGELESEDWREVHRAVHGLLFVPQPQAGGGRVNFARHTVGADEAGEVMDTLASDWLTTGPKAARFEADFAAFTGAKHALAVNSATAGLHLGLEAMGVGPGDQVITTPFTFSATAAAVRHTGAEVLFADIDRRTFNIDPDSVARLLKEKGKGVKVILPVHFAGQACDMDALLSLAGDAGARVLEDAAHALPTTYKGRMVGTIGDATVYSFYATKTIATGEGGMVTTDDEALARRIRTMRLHGIDRDAFDRYQSDKPAWYYEIVAPGYKYNMPDIAAALGIHQLARAREFRRAREIIARRYDEAFAGTALGTPHVARPGDTHAWHLYVVQLELERLKIDRDRFIALLAEAGVGTSVHFIPLHLQPYWHNRYQLRPEDFPIATDVYQRAVSLPLYPRMTEAEVERVIGSVQKILGDFAQ